MVFWEIVILFIKEEYLVLEKKWYVFWLLNGKYRMLSEFFNYYDVDFRILNFFVF